MNPILVKRFLKYNKSLVAVIGVSLLIVLFLLFIAIFKYLEMVQANAEVNEMRDTIRDLQDARKNKVAVIEGNLGRLKQDYLVYAEKNALIRPYIGHPYNKALDAMAAAMKWKNGDEVAKRFYDFLNADSRESLNDRYKRFKMDYNRAGNAWNNAIDVFKKEAQKVSFEPIDSDNVDDIFLQAIGLPREMTGRDYSDRIKVLDKNETRLTTFVLGKNIEVDEAAKDFALRKAGMNNSNQIAESMQNMEIVGDLVTRLLKGAPADRNIRYIRAINAFSYNGKTEYSEDNRITVYKYSITFTGTMSALRNVIRNLNSAIIDSRVYVLRNLKLNAPEKDSETALVLGIVQADVLKDDKGNVIEIKLKDESDKAYHERRDYGKTLIGNNPFFEITMDLDYMVLKQHEYQRR